MTTPPQDSSTRPGASPVTPGSSTSASRAGSEGSPPSSDMHAQHADARDTAAQNLDKLAESARAAASRLQQDDIGHLSEYVSDLAGSLARFSSGLRDKSADQMLREVGQLARDNPALFVTGSIAVGFGLARFMRASPPGSDADERHTVGDGHAAQHDRPRPGATPGPAGGLH